MKKRALTKEEFIEKAKGREVYSEHLNYGTKIRPTEDGKARPVPYEARRFSYYTAKTQYFCDDYMLIDDKGNREPCEIMTKLKLRLPFIPPGIKLVPEVEEDE